jgi:threonine dehydrogenase-like Zn-dependent dehydrogenase
LRALRYGVPPGAPLDAAALDDVPADVAARLCAQPVELVELADPVVDGPERVVVAPRLAGVCGSDARLLLGRFEDGDLDNPMAPFAELPFVLGHEVVGEVLDAGDRAGLAPGDRVVLDPWLTCAARGLAPCPPCRRGERSQCERFLDPAFGAGLHIGVTAAAPGAFATRLGAHASQLHVVPDGVSDAAAVLADPFCVSLHAITATPPPPGGTVLVIGAGTLGTMAVAALRRLHTDVRVVVLRRYAHQRDAALRLGAHVVLDHEPREAAIEAICALTGASARPALAGLPMAYPGGVDVVYDTVGSAETLELAVRVARSHGAVVLLGVATPHRFEWTPIYFKELRVVGSSGFGEETIAGDRRHAIDHYLALCAEGLDLSPLITHVEPLERWAGLLAAVAEPARSGVLKAAFAPQTDGDGYAAPRVPSSAERIAGSSSVAPS